MRRSWHSCSRPLVQNSHTPHVHQRGCTPTRSPDRKSETYDPTAATVPVTSCPGMIGLIAGTPPSTQSPSIMWMFDRQTPQPATSIRS